MYTTFLGQGSQCISVCALEGRRQNYGLNFQESSKIAEFLKFNESFHCLWLDVVVIRARIVLSCGLFRIVLSCKIVNSSIKFKFIHKISVIQEKFLVFLSAPRAGYNTLGGQGHFKA